MASTLTSEVPLSIEMTWLPVGGSTTRMAWGRMTLFMSPQKRFWLWLRLTTTDFAPK
ncbi:hypothetical protein J1902_15185 [Arthrobacter sp. PO-11]|uniref:Uncharacterized protein n=1 Tax=Arthrobacter cavernae TaxID=2817681 RepID=A0A939HK36_9MICC|nr:hypothetical protein [Arthrobacter cavernae]